MTDLGESKYSSLLNNPVKSAKMKTSFKTDVIQLVFMRFKTVQNYDSG